MALVALLGALAALGAARVGDGASALKPSRHEAHGSAGRARIELRSPGEVQAPRVACAPPAAPAPSTAERPPGGSSSASRLRLCVLDRDTGAPIASAVELWQLDLPADERYLAGDRRHGVLDVPADGLLLEDVPPGRYRARVHARRRPSEDPPAFDVAAPEAEVLLPVDIPAVVRLHVDLRDPEGRPIRRARRSSSFRRLAPAPVPFARERNLRPGASREPTSGRFFSDCMRSARASVMERGPLGFDLGLFRERTAGRGALHVPSLSSPEGTPVKAELPDFESIPPEPLASARIADVVLVGVSYPPGHFDAAFLLPDGRPAAEAGARISVRSESVRAGPGAPADLWRSAPCRVRVELEGYAPLVIRRAAGDDPPLPRVLAPLAR